MGLRAGSWGASGGGLKPEEEHTTAKEETGRAGRGWGQRGTPPDSREYMGGLSCSSLCLHPQRANGRVWVMGHFD